MGHESGHGTAFKTRWIDESLYQLASFMIMRDPTTWRWSHTRHHTDTLVVGRDPEIAVMRPARLAKLLANLIGLVDVPVAFWLMFRHAGGRLTADEADYVPESERRCCCYPHPLYGGKLLRLESWRAAQEHGGAAARAILGGSEPYAGVPWFWSDQHDFTLQVAGLTGEATEEVVRRRPDGVEIWFGLHADGRLVAAAAAGRANAVARDVRLAEMLIARRAAPDPLMLADPAVMLKSLLRGLSSAAVTTEKEQ